MRTSTSATVAAGPRLSVAGRDVPVVLPSLRDPRLHLAVVLLTVQVLGQTVLGFKLSVAQILVSIGMAAVVEVAVVLRREQVLAWPASAMLTGNSVALLLRATGTEHGDWWSLNGVGYFVAAVGLSLASKYLIRPGGRHVFNPSNVGLVWVLLVVGPVGVFPQYLWWGPYLSAPVLAATAVIGVGAVWILRRVRMVAMAGAFFATFGTLIAVFAVAGRSFWAIWHPVPVEGAFYWLNVVASPEVLIFVFFMMSDPATAPKTGRGRIVFGVATALVAAALVLPQQTEFGVKLAILSSLTVTCASVPALDRAVARRQRGEALVPSLPGGAWRQRLVDAARTPAVIAVAIVAVAAPLNTAALADDPQLILIERGVSGDPDPQ